MNKANECTCPSGDGSLVHPCPAHPAVEQVGGDERAAFEAAFAAMGRPVCRADYDQDAYGTPFDDGGWTGWQARAALAQPSPAQAEQAEPERPEVVAWQYRVTAGPQTGWSLWHPGKGEEFERSYTVERRPLMTVAQHGRIVEARWNRAMDLMGEHVARISEKFKAERDDALARVAELERQQPVAWMHDQPNRVDVIHRDVKDLLQRVPGSSRGIHRPLDVSEHYTIPLYAAPVAQAQHSVPEGWVQSLPLKDHQPCKPNEDRANGYTIPIYSRPVLVEEALRKLRAVLCDPIGNVVIDGSDGDREEVQRALGMLAAAPGKEGV